MLTIKQYAQANFIGAGTFGHTDAGLKEAELPWPVVSLGDVEEWDGQLPPSTLYPRLIQPFDFLLVFRWQNKRFQQPIQVNASAQFV
jgi:hypothetical protein